MRDDFLTVTKEQLARRAAFRCSNPDCRRITIGPHTLGSASVSIGVAAHITAASPGGPRFDSALSTDERSAIGNAVWLCQACARLVDADPVRYTVGILADWKQDAEADARRQLENTLSPLNADQPNSRIPPQPLRRQVSKLMSYSTGFELKSAVPDTEALRKVAQLINSHIASAYLEALDYDAPPGFVYLLLLRYKCEAKGGDRCMVEVGMISHFTPFVDSFVDRLTAASNGDVAALSGLPQFGDFKIRARYQWVANESEYLPYKITGTRSTGVLIDCVDQPVVSIRFPIKTSDLLVVISAMMMSKMIMHDDLQLDDPLQMAFLEFLTSAQLDKSFSLESVSIDHMDPESWIIESGGVALGA